MAPNLVLFLLQGGMACSTGEAAPTRAETVSEVRWLTSRLMRVAAEAQRLPEASANEVLVVHDVLLRSLQEANATQLDLIADEVSDLEVEIDTARNRQAASL